MCFSPEADLVGGLVVGAIGIDALRHVHHRAELPLASLPLLLGAHQLVEAFVWWGLRGQVSDAAGDLATWAYLLFAFVVLPVYVPLAIIASERSAHRRWAMVPFAVIGAFVAIVLLVMMIEGPVVATLEHYHLGYSVGLTYGLVIVGLYVVATCGSMLLSGYRHVVIFGAVNLPVIAGLALMARSGLISLWCAWAAVTSVAIAAHLRYGRSHSPTSPHPPTYTPEHREGCAPTPHRHPAPWRSLG